MGKSCQIHIHLLLFFFLSHRTLIAFQKNVNINRLDEVLRMYYVNVIQRTTNSMLAQAPKEIHIMCSSHQNKSKKINKRN